MLNVIRKVKRMTNKPLLSIIFLHWVDSDNKELTEITRCSLESIFKYTTVPYELIIVSNGSIDSLNEQIKTDIISYKQNKEYYYPINIKYINLETNQGVSKGFNAGLKEISEDSKYISIFSNDWIITNNTFENSIKALKNNPSMGFATSCTNWGAGSMCFDPKNPVAFPKPELDISDPEIFEKNEILGEHQEQVGEVTTINSFPAMGWLMKREVFNDVGLMDERIFCANDLSYGQRAKLFGWESRTVWSSWIYHFWHSSFSQINDRETYSYLRPKDQADIRLIQTDLYYRDKNVKNKYQNL